MARLQAKAKGTLWRWLSLPQAEGWVDRLEPLELDVDDRDVELVCERLVGEGFEVVVLDEQTTNERG